MSSSGVTLRALLVVGVAVTTRTDRVAAFDARSPGAGWTEASRSADLVIFYRDDVVLGARDVWAIGEGDGPPARYFAALNAPGALPYVTETRPIIRLSDRDEIDYVRVTAPIVNDRVSVLHVEKDLGTDANAGVFRMTWRAVAGDVPPQNHVVRLSLNQGSWTLAPLDGGRRTRITYRIIVDPAGAIPRWIAAPSAVRTVPGLFKSLRSWVATHQPPAG